MRKRTKKEKRDNYRFLRLYLEDLADLYEKDQIDDNSIMEFVSTELNRLEQNKSQSFKIDFLNFLNKKTTNEEE
jgi:hypothetical protein